MTSGTLALTFGFPAHVHEAFCKSVVRWNNRFEMWSMTHFSVHSHADGLSMANDREVGHITAVVLEGCARRKRPNFRHLQK